MKTFFLGLVVGLLFIPAGVTSGQIIEPEANHPVFKKAVEDSLQNSKLTKKSPRGAMLRALVFPGWGQWYNEQYIKAGIVFVAQSTIIAFSFYYNDKANDFPAGSVERNFYEDRRNLTYWLIAGVTLLSVLDAYIDAYLYDFDTGPDLALRFGTLRDWNGRLDAPTFGMSLRATF